MDLHIPEMNVVLGKGKPKFYDKDSVDISSTICMEELIVERHVEYRAYKRQKYKLVFRLGRMRVTLEF